MMTYSIDIFNKEYDFTLNDKVNTTIEYLNKQFQDSANRNYRRGGKRDYDPNFVVTKFEKKSEIQQHIGEIKTLLNKLTDKTFDKISEEIFTLLDKIEDNDDKFEEISKVIFKIVSSNSCFSYIYAKLYKQLVDKYEIFMKKIDICLEMNNKLIYNFVQVSSDENYDEFCKMNEDKQKRRALVSFLSNACLLKLIDLSVIIKYVNDLLNSVYQEMNKEDNRMVVEEVAEVIYIFITICNNVLKDTEEYNGFLNNINILSKLTVNDYQSCSSRAKFKYLDILDFVKKH